MFVSLVGFRFLETRVLGCRVPGHADFDEINLRFYVRREVDGEVRRAVTFVSEIVPRRAIAALARAAYNEAVRGAADAQRDQEPGRGRLHARRVRLEEPRDRSSIRAPGARRADAGRPGSHEFFIAEHYWGYTRQRDGGTLEYQVVHPAWYLRAASAQVSSDIAAFYGPAFGEVLAATPVSAYLVDGPPVTVSRPVRIK